MHKIVSTSRPKSENLALALSESSLDNLLQKAISLISDNLGTKDIFDDFIMVKFNYLAIF